MQCMSGTTIADSRLNVRVDEDAKASANEVFKKLGMNMSTGINIYLRTVASKQGIPFPLTLSREDSIGVTAAQAEEQAIIAAKSAISATKERGNPVALFDAKMNRPYYEYPDGHREYV